MGCPEVWTGDKRQEAGEIYGLFDPISGELRYIGKANSSAVRLRTHLRDCKRRSTPVYLWMRELVAPPVLKVLEQAKNWKEAEKRLIAHHREIGANLLNLAPGGNEPYCSKEIRAQNGRDNAQSRNKHFWKLKQMMGVSLRKGFVSESTKVKLREAARKAPHLFGEYALI